MSESGIERQLEEREKERQFKSEQERLREAFNADDGPREGWMREILETSDLENKLDEYELDKVRGIINKQQILSNLSEAQVHDRWYKLEVLKYRIFGEFPPDQSQIQGPLRAVVMDDELEVLTSLTAEQRNTVEQIIVSLQNMITRSESGFERKQINTNIARTEREDTENDESGGRLGLFS